ncbi:TonB family protein, partial [Taylorella asinigenitalis]
KKAEEEKRKAEEARKKAEAERIAKEKAKRDAIRGDILSRAGIKGGQNSVNQQGGGGGNSEYIRKVQACVQPHLKFNGPKKLTLRYKIILGSNNKVQSATIAVTSGNKAFDTAVLRAIYQCKPFPKPPKGNVVQGPYNYSPR